MIFVAAGEPWADAAAALFVAALRGDRCGLRLATQSVDVLMDRAASTPTTASGRRSTGSKGPSSCAG